MDENYLDSLLNEVSLDKEIDHKIEDELDSQIAKEKMQHQKENSLSMEDAFNLDLEQDAGNLGLDADLFFSEEQIDELDQLDNLADLDIGDLDFSDIDFNDLDMTKLDDLETENLDDLLKDFEGDLEIDESFNDGKEDLETEESKDITEKSVLSEVEPDTSDFIGDMEQKRELSEDGQPANDNKEDLTAEGQDDLNEDTFDTDQFLDSLLEEAEKEKQNTEDITNLEEEPQNTSEEKSVPEAETDELVDLDDILSGFDAEEQPETGNVAEVGSVSEENLSAKEEEDLDDLFALLDLDEDTTEGEKISNSSDKSEPSFDADELESIDEDVKAPNKKKTLMQILFGDPDEDDILSEEELAAVEEKKAAKKAEKAAKKQAAQEAKKEKDEKSKAEKSLKDAQKKKTAEEKKRVKALKKQKQREEELANAEPEKKLNKPMVIFIFSLFLGGTFLFYMASNNFDYTQAIKKAANYFERQKYHKAYDEIKGIEVKEKDQELKDRIYTVMYVERLYESYQNNIKLERPEKALDALLRGVDKYYEHYDEAVELGIVSDLDFSFNQIKTLLENQYGITVEQAIEINDLSDYEYVQMINNYVSKHPVTSQDDNSSADADQDAGTGNDEDAALQEEQEEEVSE